MEARGFHQLAFTDLLPALNHICQLTGRSQPAASCICVQECRRLAGLRRSEPIGWDHSSGDMRWPGTVGPKPVNMLKGGENIYL